jgi:hypothetical protein
MSLFSRIAALVATVAVTLGQLVSAVRLELPVLTASVRRTPPMETVALQAQAATTALEGGMQKTADRERVAAMGAKGEQGAMQPISMRW